MNVFELRDRLVADYADYTRSFLQIRDSRIEKLVEEELSAGLLWPEPLVQLNPAYESGGLVDELIERGLLHQGSSAIFRRNKEDGAGGIGLRLHRHQVEAIEAAHRGENYVLTTGTGSGKSLAYMIPIVDSVLREPSEGIKAIVVYPMNALANSQENELGKFLKLGFPNQKGQVTFARYTGQELEERREEIMSDPPDILLTNYVMLELLLTRPRERRLIHAAADLRFLVLDELHTYRGRQGADVAMLVRRLRETTGSKRIQFVGTSATLAGSGTFDDQRGQVAAVATTLFGAPVSPTGIIGETLRRATHTPRIDDAAWMERLRARAEGTSAAPVDQEEFSRDPLAAWVESTVGLVEDPASGRLHRATPMVIRGTDSATTRLAEATGAGADQCEQAIRGVLELGYRLKDPATGFPLFAFRLHQFFSRGDAVYASLASADQRFATTQAQQLDPTDEDRERVLLPLAFCRECGQDYYVVQQSGGSDAPTLTGRALSDLLNEEDRVRGFLFLNEKGEWPTDPAELLERLPEDWLEEGPSGRRVKSSFRKRVPQHTSVSADGTVGAPGGTPAVMVAAPLRFCLNCGVTYSGAQATDFGKLTTLGSGGRSSATSLLSLSAVSQLRQADLPKHAKKLLAFTDNRQDASLQAGHFNDFVQVGLLRSALHSAALAGAPSGGLRHDTLTDSVTAALDLPLEQYAQDPSVRFLARQETDGALRDVVGYRLYRDLERGWRVTAPNLEQTGLLRIEYQSLSELAADEGSWKELAPALAASSAADREEVGRVLLDYLRRSLAIQVPYLVAVWQEQLRLRSNQHLVQPWAVDDEERLETASVAYPRQARAGDYGGNVYVSGRGGMGLFVARFLRKAGHEARLEDREHVIRDLFEVLRVAGLVALVDEPKQSGDPGGYQLKAAGMRWIGHTAESPARFSDPIRVPQAPKGGHRTNPFFMRFYTETASKIAGIESKEHTAQVPSGERIAREEAFREGRLPILYCSPTMELGVDIAELNVVGLRNVPPTPANYAQRSGRAGRSGTPALVFSYCAWGSSHDQYFFRRPAEMVAGQVRPPRLDLANEDLVRSHVHALWLAETGLDLKTSLADILELDGEPPSLQLTDSVLDSINNQAARERARRKAARVLATLDGIESSDWHNERWLDDVINAVAARFDEACDRWRDLYRSAWKNRAAQHAIVGDHSRPLKERNRAQQLRDQAESQLKLLTGETDESRIQSDFYSYRYFASEGFLPGYSFPRLPLSAWIPGRRGRSGRDDYLSRPRFLAISEFGPRTIVYHEGSRYRITQVMLPPERAEGNRLVMQRAKRCDMCGYLHQIDGGDPGPDLCEHCGALLPGAVDQLFRLRNVVTRRQDRITSDEEERQRQGFEIWTSVRFAVHDGLPSARKASLTSGNGSLANVVYAPAATIWRMNVGWRRRANQEQLGFVLDTERGYWAKSNEDADDSEDPMSQSRERVIPYVEDTRNVLLLTPAAKPQAEVMATLAASLKAAIQTEYQLEDSELAVEALPSDEDRRQLLIYEAAEGGAGVLRRLAGDPEAFANVARTALRICHFDEAGADLGRPPGARDICVAACYDCLMNYNNQRDHRLLDRHAVRDLLLAMAAGRTEASASYKPREDHLAGLRRVAESSLERRWLEAVEQGGYNMPTRGQHYVESANARPDFLYEDKVAVIYIDGPVHDFDDVQQRDTAAQTRLEEQGFYVLRFGSDPTIWGEIFAANPGVFGRRP